MERVEGGTYYAGRPAPRIRKRKLFTKGRSEMRYVLSLMFVAPLQHMVDSSPSVKAAGLMFGGVAGFVWGEAFLVLFLLYGAAALWDFILGGQLAARITRAAVARGENPEEYGGFDSEIARSGLLVKVSLPVQITILFIGELWILHTLRVGYLDVLPSALSSLSLPTNMAVLSSTIMAAAALNELRSCERNRRMLGGTKIPVFSNTMDLLDKLAERLVPPADPEKDEGWHTLPRVDGGRGVRHRRRTRGNRGE